jgi:hypothetical protein
MRYEIIIAGPHDALAAAMRQHLAGAQLSESAAPQYLSGTSGHAVFELTFESTDTERVEAMLEAWRAQGPQQPPYPQGALLRWERLSGNRLS